MIDKAHDPYEWIWLSALILVAVLLFWYFFGDQLTAYALHIKQAQLWILTAIKPDAALLTLQQSVNYSLHNPAPVSFSALVFVMDAVGQYLRPLLMTVLLLIGLWLIWAHPADSYKKRFDVKQLAETMGQQWPFALHALRRNHIDIPLDHPRWGMALSEWAWVHKHNLWSEDMQALDRTKTEQALIEQLGERWQGHKNLPLHAQALAGIFAMRCVSVSVADDKTAAQLKTQSYDLLRKLAQAAANNKKNDYRPALADYRKIVDKTANYFSDTKLKQAIEEHAWQHTVIMRLLEDARQNGIFASALFNWLKGVDRPLWYALTTLGRRAPFVEAIAVFSHYQQERQIERAITDPLLSNALQGLISSLNKQKRPTGQAQHV